MTPVAFSIVVLALLATPGPTNTLLALAGAEGGLRRALRLIPAESAAYALVTVPLSLAGVALLPALPGLGAALAVIASAWVLFLAVKLWRLPVPGLASRAVTAGQVFVTTLLNPKALILGLVLMPAGNPAEYPVRLALFMLIALAVAAGWAALGAMSRCAASSNALRRAAALWLGVVSAGLAAGAMTA